MSQPPPWSKKVGMAPHPLRLPSHPPPCLDATSPFATQKVPDGCTSPWWGGNLSSLSLCALCGYGIFTPCFKQLLEVGAFIPHPLIVKQAPRHASDQGQGHSQGTLPGKTTTGKGVFHSIPHLPPSSAGSPSQGPGVPRPVSSASPPPPLPFRPWPAALVSRQPASGFRRAETAGSWQASSRLF